MLFLSLNSRSRDLGPPKLGHTTHLLIPMMSPNFSVLPFASYEQINLHLPKFANKNKGTMRSREVPTTVPSKILKSLNEVQ